MNSREYVSNLYKDIAKMPYTNTTETINLIDKSTADVSDKDHGIIDRVGPQDDNTSFWKSGRSGVVMCILFAELCESLTFFSISANLVLFCTSVLLTDSPTAATISLAFNGTLYLIPVFGGYIADTVAGKCNTIYGSALIYFAGAAIQLLLLTEYVSEFSVKAKRGFFGVSLLLVAIGSGGLKSNVGPFGAQQLKDLGDGAIRSFFNWFYWFVNLGSGIAFSVVAYIQQEISFFYGFLIPTISIFLANGLLLLQRHKYITHPPEGSALTNIVKVTAIGARGCCQKRETAEAVNIQSRFEYAKESNGGKYPDCDVESTKSILRILPIFVTFVLYWTIYDQMFSTYFLQGERLLLKYNGFTIPVALLNLFNCAIILILIPIVDRFLYPKLGEWGINFTQLRRIGTGMILATLSVAVAGIVEIKRKNIMRDGHYIQQNLSTEVFNASDLSVMMQIPQFALIGASEVLVSITGLEFAYSQSPLALQGVIMGLYFLTSGLGSYVGSLLVLIVNSISRALGSEWLPDEPNDGHLEYFFFLLVGLMMLNFVLYLWVSSDFEYVQPTGALNFADYEDRGRRTNDFTKEKTTEHDKVETFSESEM